MAITYKSLTIAHRVSVKSSTDGRETGTEIFSQPGLQASFVLSPDGDFELGRELGFVHVDISSDTDNLPDLPQSELREWLRVRLIKMLGGTVLAEH